MVNKSKFFSLVVPVYNEEGNIPLFINRAEKALDKFSDKFEIIFCIDPSTDNTAEVITKHSKKNKNIKGLLFSRKFGQPACTYAGISYASGHHIGVIDVDLQDPPELLIEMYKKLIISKSDIALATRRSREGETLIKKLVAHFGYKFVNFFTETKIPVNTGDFRIMSRKAANELLKLRETHCFLRGMVSFIGFKTCSILYDRDPRYAETSKYNKFFGSFTIGFNGIIGFSSKPLRHLLFLGVSISILSFFIGLYYLYQKLSGQVITPGLSSTIIFISFFSGVNMMALGLIGEYVGRIYDQVKNRPLFIVDQKINL